MNGKQAGDGNITVAFKFGMDETVWTPFGDKGIVSMLAFDEGGNTYYVKTSTGANWFKESQLEKIQ